MTTFCVQLYGQVMQGLVDLHNILRGQYIQNPSLKERVTYNAAKTEEYTSGKNKNRFDGKNAAHKSASLYKIMNHSSASPQVVNGENCDGSKHPQYVHT